MSAPAVDRNSRFSPQGIVDLLQHWRDWLALQFRKVPAAGRKGCGPRMDKPPKPDSDYVALPEGLRSLLKGFRRRHILIQWVRGGCWFAWVFPVLLLLQALWDWCASLPIVIRAIFLTGDFVLLAGGIWILLWKPFRQPPSFEECALSLERFYPNLRSGLISAVQFSTGEPTTLQRELFKQVEKIAPLIRFEDALSWGLVRRPVAIALTIFTLSIFIIAMTWPGSGILLSRIALGSRPVPAETTIVSITPDTQIAAGDAIRIEVRASGMIPKSGRLEVARTGIPPVRATLLPAPSEAGLFTVTLPNVQDAFSFHAVINGAQSPVSSVKVLHPPHVAAVNFVRHDPDYTNAPTVRLDPGRLEVFAGGGLEISGESTRPMRSARLEFTKGGQFPLSVDGKKFCGLLPIPAAGLEGFSIVLEDDEGTTSRNNTLHRLKIIRDDPPKIIWKPGGFEFRSVVAESKPQLAFSVNDNFLVTAVELVASVEAGQETGREIRIPVRIPGPAAGYDFDELIENPGKLLPWKVGTTISYWIEARDNNTATGPGIGKSSIRSWRVISKDEKRREIYEQLENNARRVKELSDIQRALREDVEKLVKP